MPSSAAPPRARMTARRRGQTILDALISGRTLEAIADAERLTVRRVERLVHDALGRRPVAAADDYARLQIVRLEAMAGALAPRAADGEPPAIDRLLKILDRLDRYHGFASFAAPAVEPDEGGRERLLAKLNAMAERMIAARKPEA